MTSHPNSPTTEESLLAAISHFFGLLGALIVWATPKDKSRYLRFQTDQAMMYDMVTFAFLTIVMGSLLVVIVVLLALGVGDLALFGSQNNPVAEPIRLFLSMMDALPLLIPSILLFIAGVFLILRLVATIQTAQRKDYRYPWLGALVERAMEN